MIKEKFETRIVESKAKLECNCFCLNSDAVAQATGSAVHKMIHKK
jgi:hypothetical protein